MKKQLVAAIALFLCLALAACGAQSASPSAQESSLSESPASQGAPVVLREQVEQAAKYFFGDGCAVEHRSGGIWIYHPLQGIYTAIPTDSDGFKNGSPLINAYVYNDDGTVELLLSYTAHRMTDPETAAVPYDADQPLTGTYAGNLADGIPAGQRDNAAAYADSGATWHKIVLNYDSEKGSYTFVSHGYDVRELADALYPMASGIDEH